MAQIYFHCSTAEGVLIDRSGAALGDLAEARELAALVVQSLIIGAAGSCMSATIAAMKS
jgi:ABC-type transporter Mla maintaining outer membrane lipid asymmetry permease subunit MlaE